MQTTFKRNSASPTSTKEVFVQCSKHFQLQKYTKVYVKTKGTHRKILKYLRHSLRMHAILIVTDSVTMHVLFTEFLWKYRQ